MIDFFSPKAQDLNRFISPDNQRLMLANNPIWFASIKRPMKDMYELLQDIYQVTWQLQDSAYADKVQGDYALYVSPGMYYTLKMRMGDRLPVLDELMMFHKQHQIVRNVFGVAECSWIADGNDAIVLARASLRDHMMPQNKLETRYHDWTPPYQAVSQPSLQIHTENDDEKDGSGGN